MLLEVVEGDASGARIGVAGELLIGRSTEDAGVLGGDPELSRRHAIVRREQGGSFSIEDLGSMNGTLVNGEPVTERKYLQVGDKIEVGRSVIEVRPDAPSAGRAAPDAELIYREERVRVPVEGLAIGRTEDNDLVIDTPGTSRRHARVYSRDGRHFVSDLGSANGTRLNGELLQSAVRGLSSGDRLLIGGETLHFAAGGARG